MSTLVLKGSKVVSMAKSNMPLIKKAGKTAATFVMTSGTGKELIDKMINTRERNKLIKELNEKYDKATSFEEKKMIMEYRMKYVN